MLAGSLCRDQQSGSSSLCAEQSFGRLELDTPGFMAQVSHCGGKEIRADM